MDGRLNNKMSKWEKIYWFSNPLFLLCLLAFFISDNVGKVVKCYKYFRGVIDE